MTKTLMNTEEAINSARKKHLKSYFEAMEASPIPITIKEETHVVALGDDQLWLHSRSDISRLCDTLSPLANAVISDPSITHKKYNEATFSSGIITYNAGWQGKISIYPSEVLDLVRALDCVELLCYSKELDVFNIIEEMEEEYRQFIKEKDAEELGYPLKKWLKSIYPPNDICGHRPAEVCQKFNKWCRINNHPQMKVSEFEAKIFIHLRIDTERRKTGNKRSRKFFKEMR